MNYTVLYGDCLSTIARRHGLTWRDLWEHPQNAEFRAKRKDPNVLYPGDEVFIPVAEPKSEPGATEQRHRFTLLSAPIKLCVRILHHGEPLASEPYLLEIDGLPLEGSTDGDGQLTERLPTDAKTAWLTMVNNGERRQLNIGGLDPVSELAGVQGRLHNLGFYVGEIDGIWGPLTKGAVGRFQERYVLPTSSRLDHQTRDAIEHHHGC